MSVKELNAVVNQRIEIAPGLIKLRIVPDGWELPDFTPGQYGVLGLPGSAGRYAASDPEASPPSDPDKMIQRAYSVASSSIAKEYLEFYISLVRSGALTPRLLNLKAKEKIWLSPKLKGMFTMAEIPDEYNIILCATGTGVAPYMSMIRTELSKGLRHRIAVIHGANHASELGYNDELRTLHAISDRFLYLPILSHAHEESIPWNGAQGFIQDLWNSGALEKAWGFHPKPEDTHVFLCGNPLMVDAMTDVLTTEGFEMHSKKEPGQIHTEKYFVNLED
ncbi:MAG: ferredoxin--NADP reductase [Candidatus Zixiibacteriota bacterium]